jgi:hypothetical protein
MKFNRHAILALIAALTIFATLGVGTVSADTTTAGTWVPYPGQSVTTTTTTSTHTAYQVNVRAPINADGSSNWPKKRGVIPVQFDLLAATATDTTTTTTVGPFVFESIGSDASTDNDVSYVSFTPSSPMTFNDITELSSAYAFTQGDCHGGSLRWQVRTDANHAVFIYYGKPSEFGNGGIEGCTPTSTLGVDQSGTNLIGLSDLRYDTSQYAGGTFYDTYAHTQLLVGTTPIIRASLVIDSGWGGDQIVDLTSATVNDNTFTPLPTGTTSTTTTTVGSYSPTCDLPAARLKWSKSDPFPDGSLNEAESIQPKDTGEFYRIVDCKYIYNLDVSSLDPNLATRGGTYYVYVEIGGTSINNYAKFDLK